MFKYQMVRSLGLLIAAGVGLSACGNNPMNFVKGARAETFQQNGASFAQVQTDLSVGNIGLPSFSLPILDPNNLAVSYGSLSLAPGANGLTELTIDVNLTAAAGVSGGASVLPNGTPIPIGGLNGASVIELPVSGTSAKIYLAFGSDFALFGAAIPINEFNPVGGVVGGADLFFPFTVDSNLSGTAGLFTGRGSGQNGFAVFIDVTGLQSLAFAAVKPASSRVQNRIQNAVLQMHFNRTQVHLN
jgi:hypothetical protein